LQFGEVPEAVLENGLVVSFAVAIAIAVGVVVVVLVGGVSIGINLLLALVGIVATALLRYLDPKEVGGSRPLYDSAKDRSVRSERDPSLQARRTCS
jgi:hypothetical protein